MSAASKDIVIAPAAVTGACNKCMSTAGQWSDPDPPRKPMRKRFDEEMDRINNAIKAKEQELHQLDQSQQPVSPGQSTVNVWQQKDETIARRRAIDERLQAANKEIANKRDVVARIHSTLNYKSEDRINEAIKRLEYQLRVNNFKVNEERRIVKEIDNLNRSRRNLKEYTDKKAELDMALKEQQEMRNERDALFRSVTTLNQAAETMKRESKERKAKAEAIKKELDDLYAQKRQKLNSYRQNFAKYQQYRAKVKRQTPKQEDPTKKEEPECVSQIAYSEKRQLCVTLLSYLQRFEYSQVTSAMTPNMANNDLLATLQHPGSEGHTPVTPMGEVTPLRKKEESGDEEWSLYSSGKGARAKRNHTKKLRQQLKKPITHASEVFEQFSRLQLCAPALLAEVPVAIEQLKAKKKFYEHLSQAGPLEEIPDLPLYSLSIASADAKTKDEIQDVIPSPATDIQENTESQGVQQKIQDVTTNPEIQTNSYPELVCQGLQDAPPTTKSVKVQLDSPGSPPKGTVTVPSTMNNSSTPTVVIVNSVPKTLNLETRNNVVHLNGYHDELDEVDNSYSFEKGYSKYNLKNGMKMVQSSLHQNLTTSMENITVQTMS